MALLNTFTTMSETSNYFKELFRGIKTLITGLKVTGKYFVKPGTRVTQQYPNNRETLQMFERMQGEVAMPHNDNNEHRCTGCGICELNCPNGSIEIITKWEIIDEKKKKAIDKHIYHLSMCTFCGLCVKVCPSNALKFDNTFEHAVYDRSQLTKVLNKPNSVVNLNK